MKTDHLYLILKNWEELDSEKKSDILAFLAANPAMDLITIPREHGTILVLMGAEHTGILFSMVI